MIKKFLSLTLLLLLFTIAGCKDNEPENETSDNENETEIITNDVYIECEENGQHYQVHAFAGHVIVYFNPGVEEETAKASIESLGGKILHQSPEIGYYLVDAGAGNENNFIHKIYEKNVEFAALDIIYEACGIESAAKILDNFITNLPGENTTHGARVAEVFKNCSGEATYMAGRELGYTDKKGRALIKGEKAIQEIRQNSDMYLYNMSFGPSLVDKNDKDIPWKEADAAQKLSYTEQQKLQIKQVIMQLSRLRPDQLSNTVVTIAAGNKGMPDFYNGIIKPMLTRPKPNVNNPYYLDEKQRSILKNNILILTASDKKDTSYSNKSSAHYAIADVDISDLKWKGTSYAAPRALCYVVQIMKAKNLTATEALAAAKASIATHGGKLIIEKTLEETIGNIVPRIYVANVKDKSATITVNIDAQKIIDERQGTPTSIGYCISTTSMTPTAISGTSAYTNASNYPFSCTLKPQTLYFVRGVVRTSSNKTIYGNVTSFITPPTEEGLPVYLNGSVFSVTFWGFNPADNCKYEDLIGNLTFKTTSIGEIKNTEVLFETNKGNFTGNYLIGGSRFNIEFSDLLLTGGVSYNMQMSGEGKHYAGGEEIHKFSWRGVLIK